MTNLIVNGTFAADSDWTKGAAPIADFPTSLPTAGNIPLVVTDSIQTGAQVTLS